QRSTPASRSRRGSRNGGSPSACTRRSSAPRSAPPAGRTGSGSRSQKVTGWPATSSAPGTPAAGRTAGTPSAASQAATSASLRARSRSAALRPIRTTTGSASRSNTAFSPNATSRAPSGARPAARHASASTSRARSRPKGRSPDSASAPIAVLPLRSHSRDRTAAGARPGTQLRRGKRAPATGRGRPPAGATDEGGPRSVRAGNEADERQAPAQAAVLLGGDRGSGGRAAGRRPGGPRVALRVPCHQRGALVRIGEAGLRLEPAQPHQHRRPGPHPQVPVPVGPLAEPGADHVRPGGRVVLDDLDHRPQHPPGAAGDVRKQQEPPAEQPAQPPPVQVHRQPVAVPLQPVRAASPDLVHRTASPTAPPPRGAPSGRLPTEDVRRAARNKAGHARSPRSKRSVPAKGADRRPRRRSAPVDVADPVPGPRGGQVQQDGGLPLGLLGGGGRRRPVRRPAGPRLKRAATAEEGTGRAGPPERRRLTGPGLKQAATA